MISIVLSLESPSIIGVKSNPYPYFKCCDIYVQTSRHEGYATTVSEAKVFCKPIITTDVSGAKEQIRTGENGFITSFDAVPSPIIHQLNTIPFSFNFSATSTTISYPFCYFD